MKFTHQILLITQTTRLIGDIAETVRNTIKSEIKVIYEQYGGSVSMDCWTDKCRKLCYFGLTLHYISEENSELVMNDRILLIREMTAETKDGNYLKAKLVDYLIEFGIMDCVENKIVFVSDRGSNIKAALRPYQSISCMAHMIHNGVEKILDKNAIVSAVSTIVRYFKTSGQNAIFEQTLKSYVSTRWSSVYRMLESVIQHWNEIVDILKQKNAHLKELQSISLEELKLMRDFLKPFAEATLEIEATKKATLDAVCPWFLSLKNHLTYKRTDPKMITDFKDIGYKYWVENVSVQISIYHQIAVFLNPSLKSLKPFEVEERMRIYKKTEEMVENYVPKPTNNELLSEPSETRLVKRANLSKAMAAFADDVDHNDEPNLIADEINEYKNMRVAAFESVLEWWQQNKLRLPRLYSVARFIFAIPASSAGPERIFSAAGRLVSYRPNLCPYRVDDILFLKSNFDLFIKNKKCSMSQAHDANNDNGDIIGNEGQIEIDENDEGIECFD